MQTYSRFHKDVRIRINSVCMEFCSFQNIFMFVDILVILASTKQLNLLEIKKQTELVLEFNSLMSAKYSFSFTVDFHCLSI